LSNPPIGGCPDEQKPAPAARRLTADKVGRQKFIFPRPPFLFARLLETPSDFFGRRDLKFGGGLVSFYY